MITQGLGDCPLTCSLSWRQCLASGAEAVAGDVQGHSPGQRAGSEGPLKPPISLLAAGPYTLQASPGLCYLSVGSGLVEASAPIWLRHTRRNADGQPGIPTATSRPASQPHAQHALPWLKLHPSGVLRDLGLMEIVRDCLWPRASFLTAEESWEKGITKRGVVPPLCQPLCRWHTRQLSPACRRPTLQIWGWPVTELCEPIP